MEFAKGPRSGDHSVRRSRTPLSTLSTLCLWQSVETTLLSVASFVAEAGRGFANLVAEAVREGVYIREAESLGDR